MKLKSLNKYIGLLILFILFLPLQAEEEIDIWNKEKKESLDTTKSENNNLNTTIDSKKISNTIKINTGIQIENKILESSDKINIFGIFDPAENNFDLNMWSRTDAEKIRTSVKRISKINLSNTSKEIFEKILFSFSYPPQGMSENEFIDLKINWMLDNNRSELIEKFLKQNKIFHNKPKVIQYLVDENIAKANIKKVAKR